MSMRALWKVPASVVLIVVLTIFLLVALPPLILLTFAWLPLVMSDVMDSDPPVFWAFDALSRVFDWWAEV
jgi:hypothetical protein